MPRKPSTHRKDANHDAIVQIAEAHGWQVVSLTSAGSGVPDLLVWRASEGFLLIEVKAGKGKGFTDAQKAFQRRYTVPVLYLRTEDEAHEALKGTR